ncbi:MAG: SAM-dependent methyltransferase [Lachnospiraceae bacterium]|nr:SAM-dependent methyltransferase [Lachnospiraceae bacterium]
MKGMIVMDGIVSKERVKEFGEVFTPDSIVNDMMDLVDSKLDTKYSDKEYISNIILEPACGDGQFLVRILYRKLERVRKLPVEERQLHLIKALCSTIGVDIQEDNVKRARERMQAIATGKAVKTFDLSDTTNIIQIDLGIEYTERLNSIINYILERNIICGNTLDDNAPIILSDYKFNGDKVIVEECALNELDNVINSSNEVYYMELDNVGETDSIYTDNYDF